MSMVTTRWLPGVALLLQSLPGCATSERVASVPEVHAVPLVTTLDDGVADSQVVPVHYLGSDAWLALDTGAPFTFLFSDPDGPEYLEEGGCVEIGGERWRLPGYRDDAIGVEMFRERPIVGVLGLDFFRDVPAEIDYPGGRIVRHLDGELPPGDAALPAIPLRGGTHGRALVDVSLDGKVHTLMFDTGAHDTILIDAPSGAEEGEKGQVQTADGRVWDVQLVLGRLLFPEGEERAVSVLRAGDLEYIAPELRQLHARGLFGLTSLGWRRVILDFEAGVLRLGPLRDPEP